MTSDTTTVSIPKSVLALVEPYSHIKDETTGVEVTVPLSKVISAIIIQWHQIQLEKVGE